MKMLNKLYDLSKQKDRNEYAESDQERTTREHKEAFDGLLEACKEARRYIVDYADIPVMKRVLPIIELAIKQVEGE